MTIYNKLVRDRIPEIIEGRGETAVHRALSDNEFRAALLSKFDEELAEFKKEFEGQDANAALEELADISELVDAAATVLGSGFGEIMRLKSEKAAARGGFARRILLVETK